MTQTASCCAPPRAINWRAWPRPNYRRARLLLVAQRAVQFFTDPFEFKAGSAAAVAAAERLVCVAVVRAARRQYREALAAWRRLPKRERAKTPAPRRPGVARLRGTIARRLGRLHMRDAPSACALYRMLARYERGGLRTLIGRWPPGRPSGAVTMKLRPELWREYVRLRQRGLSRAAAHRKITARAKARGMYFISIGAVARRERDGEHALALRPYLLASVHLN